MNHKGYFITGTDTGVGKTIAVLCLGVWLKNKGVDVGVFKPVQCAGNDARLLKKKLNLSDPLKAINPYFAKEPLSPHLAFTRQKETVDIAAIKKSYQAVSEKHQITLVEGAGGLMVPLKKNYLVVDLIRELDLEVIIVSRLSLGTINHTLLTIGQARHYGLNVKGVIFNTVKKTKAGIAEQTNAKAVQEFGRVEILGEIPYLASLDEKNILEKVKFSRKVLRKEKNVLSRLADDDRKYVWHPFTQMKDWEQTVPLVIDRADGAYLMDAQGNRYLDGVSSLWVNVHGHRKKEMDEALKDQINKVSHSTLLGLSNTPSIQLAKKLIEITPKGLDKVFYSDSGSTAVEIAVKMAYQYWQNTGRKAKKRLLHLSHSYHGDTLGSVSVGGIQLFHKVYRDLVIKTVAIGFPDCYRAPAGKAYPDYAFECLKQFEHYLEKNADTAAAFIAEPIVQGAGGMIVWPKGILTKMRQLCEKYDVLFIADEVATGFGRTGQMFACAHEGVTPDIMCLAKGITGGYLPLAATLTSQRIYDGFCYDYEEQKTFFHGHTYTGNPLGCAAALKNLELFEKEKVLAKLAGKINHMEKQLKMFYNLNLVGDVRQFGFMAGIELVKDKAKKTPFPWREQIGVQVCQRLREKNIILRPLGNVIVLMPPLSITIKELKYLLDCTYDTIGEMAQTLK